MFDELFVKADNNAIFNRTGSNFWSRIRELLLDALFLSISRFLDPAATRNKKNFSLDAILLIPQLDSIRPEMETQVSEL